MLKRLLLAWWCVLLLASMANAQLIISPSVRLTTANTWTQLQTFSAGAAVTSPLNVLYSSVLFDRLSVNSTGALLIQATEKAPGASTAALAGLGAGNVNSGTHSYKVTFVTAGGETDAGAVSGTVTTTAGNGQVALSAIPTGSTAVTSRKLYRTAAGNDVTGPWLLLATIADNSTTTYADNIADGSLTTTIPSANTAIDTRTTLTNAGALIQPTLLGGTGTTSTLTLQSTSGVGASGADIIFKVGNNGATEAGRFNNAGLLTLANGLTLSGGGLTFGSSSTLGLDAANTLALKNGSNAQEWRVYHNATQYLKANIYGIYLDETGLQNESSGVWLNGFLALSLDNSNNLTLKTRGGSAIQPEADNTRDFGSTSRRIRSGLFGTSVLLAGTNGQSYTTGRLTELVAVGSGLTTKATTIQIPADAIVYAVPVRVVTQPGGTTTMTVTATTSGTAFQKGANISTAAGTTDPGTKNTPVNYNSVAAQTITFTFNAATTDALGVIRIDLYYSTATPPTS